jgi:hypothetical protein
MNAAPDIDTPATGLDWLRLVQEKVEKLHHGVVPHDVHERRVAQMEGTGKASMAGY